MGDRQRNTIFENRWDAALRLIPMLSRYADEPCVVLVIPRGGVPIGYAIAKSYSFPLDILLTKKIGHPNNPELAIGAVSLESETVDPNFNVPEEYVRQQIPLIRESLRQRRTKFMGDRAPVDITDKVVIIVDDGIATGHTLMAAIGMIRHRSPGKIVVAVPIAPRQTASKFRELVDEFVCPCMPDDFNAVGQFYKDFAEVTDEDVISLMKDAEALRKTDPNSSTGRAPKT